MQSRGGGGGRRRRQRPFHPQMDKGQERSIGMKIQHETRLADEGQEGGEEEDKEE